MKGIIRLLIAAAFPLTAVAGTIGRPENKSSQVVINQDEVSKNDIKKYLKDLGYKVHDVEQVPGTCNWTCKTSKDGKDFITTVFTDCSIIGGHEDVDI